MCLRTPANAFNDRAKQEQDVSGLRQRYASLLSSAPDSKAAEVLRAQLAVLNHVMSRETGATCRVAKLYAAALSLQGEPGRHIKTTLLYEIARN